MRSKVLGLMINSAVAGSFFDDFERADETPVASPWTTPGWCSPQNLLNGALVSPGPGVRGSVVDVSAFDLGTDVIVTADFTVNSGASPDVGIIISNAASWICFTNNHTSWGVYVVDGFGNVTTTIATGSGAPGGAVHKVFEVSAIGQAYTYIINGTTLWTGTYGGLTRTSTEYGWLNGRDENTNTLNSFGVEAA